MILEVVSVVYVIVAVLWGMFCVKTQRVINPDKSGSVRLLLNFLVNATFCPLSLVLALDKHDSHVEGIRIEGIKKTC